MLNGPFYPVDVAEQFGFEKKKSNPEHCCFCNKELNYLTANDARPVNDGQCCICCNMKIVVPERIRMLKEAT